jgi:hypothetical protein
MTFDVVTLYKIKQHASYKTRHDSETVAVLLDKGAADAWMLMRYPNRIGSSYYGYCESVQAICVDGAYYETKHVWVKGSNSDVSQDTILPLYKIVTYYLDVTYKPYDQKDMFCFLNKQEADKELVIAQNYNSGWTCETRKIGQVEVKTILHGHSFHELFPVTLTQIPESIVNYAERREKILSKLTFEERDIVFGLNNAI